MVFMISGVHNNSQQNRYRQANRQTDKQTDRQQACKRTSSQGKKTQIGNVNYTNVLVLFSDRFGVF